MYVLHVHVRVYKREIAQIIAAMHVHVRTCSDKGTATINFNAY